MGIATSTAALLCEARAAGTRFGAVATIGRLRLTVPQAELGALARRFGVAETWRDGVRSGDYAEAFLADFLGASSVVSFDRSERDAATELHDFNRPVPPAQRGAYDTLIDGGTMEHIFDVRQVVENYMSMIRVGGQIFMVVPANNLFGHGFYQFSSEFFFRVFSPDNGFAVEQAVVIETPFATVEASRTQRCYRTIDPRRAGKRVRLVGDKPLTIFVHARKREEVPPFRSMPIQAGYDGEAKHEESQPDVGSFEYIGRFEALRRRLQQRRNHSLRNRRFFERLDR